MLKKLINYFWLISVIFSLMYSFTSCMPEASFSDEIIVNDAKDNISIKNVKGIQVESINSIQMIEKEEDLNWVPEEIVLGIDERELQIGVTIEEEEIIFGLEMYPSKMGIDNQNRMIGIENYNSSGKYNIIRFIIEKEASLMYLFQPNSKYLGETVINLGILNTETGKVYLIQFVENQLDYELLYSKLSNKEYSDQDLMDQELSYFSLQNISDIKDSFESSDEEIVEDSGYACIEDGNNIERFEEIE